MAKPCFFVDHGGVNRRLDLPEPVGNPPVITLASIKALIQQKHSGYNDASYWLTYDDNGEAVTVDSDEILQEAVAFFNEQQKRLKLTTIAYLAFMLNSALGLTASN